MISPFVAILPSAGSGSRFNSDIPKQYCPIGDQMIIEFSLELLAKVDECQAICIPVSKNDVYHKEIADHPKFHFIEGGASRAESVKKGVDFLDSENLTYNNILIHDPVRPCLTKAELKRMLTEFCDSAFQALILAVPVSDTLKLSENNHIQSTISRENVWRALTPQFFKFDIIKEAVDLAKNEGRIFTDEAQAVEHLGGEVDIVLGHTDNIKITFEEDLQLARYFLSSRGEL